MEHTGSYASGRFCSVKCARSFSTLNDMLETKQTKCINCGLNIFINKRTSVSVAKCKKCKKPYIPKKKYKHE